MALFLLENRDFLGFRMIFKVQIWNAAVSVITRSTFSSFQLYFVKVHLFFYNYISYMLLSQCLRLVLKLEY
jgi:hypothetical protein